jgi:ankyrin repeat protein
VFGRHSGTTWTPENFSADERDGIVKRHFLKAILFFIFFAGLAAARASDAAMSADDFVELCGKGTPQQVQTAIDAGADVDAKDHNGRTALMQAAWFGNKEAISLLLKAGADINAKDNDGWTALIGAAEVSSEVVYLLLQAGADVNAKANDGWTALMLATREEDSNEVISLLLQAGADVNVKDNEGKTALMIAAEWGARAEEAVSLLLRAGADVNAKDNQGKTALDYAEKDSEIYKQIAGLTKR